MLEMVLRSTVGRRRYRRLLSRAEWYKETPSREQTEHLQLTRFNQVWADALERVPFYRSWAQEHSLPVQIQRLSDLQDFPPLTKDVIVRRSEEIFTDARGRRIQDAYQTGGSTGASASYPRGPGDDEGMAANAYAARDWWGIRPFDSYVHVWGHSHLFGGGPKARLVRRVKDVLVNEVRLNAYDMSADAISSNMVTILKRNPRFVVGYTSAIFKLARHAESAGLDMSTLTNLRGVIVTSETVTHTDVEVISAAFGAPVIIEYGAAETGVMAYSRGSSWPLQVLWRSFILTVDREDLISVTTLDRRTFPLVNYCMGDVAKGGDIVDGNAITLGAINGRAQDTVTVDTLDQGHLELSAILPVHILKIIPSIIAVQYRQLAPGQLTIFLTANQKLDLAQVESHFSTHLRREHPTFDPSSVTFTQVADPVLTRAGKQALFV